MTGTKIRFGFKSKNQLPFFMIWEETWENGEVVMGHVIFSTGRWGF